MPKPSQFSSTDPVLGTEWVIIEKGGTTYKVALSRIKDYAASISLQPANLAAPIVCGSSMTESNFHIRINGGFPSMSDTVRGGFCAIHNKGKGFTATTLSSYLPTSFPYNGSNLLTEFSTPTIDADGGVSSLCVGYRWRTCGVYETDNNGNGIRHYLIIVGNNGDVHTFNGHSIDHASNGSLITDWTTLITQAQGVEYAVIEIYGNSQYHDNPSEGEDYLCNFE